MVKTLSKLSALNSFSAVKVDKAAGIIRNVAVMTLGPAIGHGFMVDQTSLDQTLSLALAHGELKTRYKHPAIAKDGITLADDLGMVVGKVTNFQMADGSIRGDIELGSYAECLPGLGDVKTYLLDLADKEPTNLGLSAVIVWEPEIVDGIPIPVARVLEVQGADFVGKPASNPNGLLGAKGDGIMDPKLKAQLVKLGMNPDASDEKAQAFHDCLSDDTKANVAELAAEDGEPDDGNGEKKKDQLKKDAQGHGADTGHLDGANPDEIAAAFSHMSARKQAAMSANVLAAEKARVGQITQLAALYGLDAADRDQVIADDLPVEQSRVRLLQAKSRNTKPISGITVGADKANVAMLSAIPDAIAMKAGTTVKNHHELAPKLAKLRMTDMARQYLATLGCDVRYTPDAQIASYMLCPAVLRKDFPRVALLAEGTSDFGNITLDAINKTLRPAYLDAPKTWTNWVRRGTAKDFKNINRVALSDMPSTFLRQQGAEFKFVTLSDSKEIYALKEYSGGIKLTRRAVINDDMDAFSRLPLLMANACWRLEEELVYGVLTANAAMSDTYALFGTNHANLVALTAGKATVNLSSTKETERLMITQKGPAGAARLGLRPKFIITPASLKADTELFLTSANLAAVISTSSAAPVLSGTNNPYAGKLTHVWTPVLDDDSTTKWYMASDYRDNQVDTIEISFLEGEPEPVIRQQTEFNTEDVDFVVRHTAAAAAIDFRGLVQNPGA